MLIIAFEGIKPLCAPGSVLIKIPVGTGGNAGTNGNDALMAVKVSSLLDIVVLVCSPTIIIPQLFPTFVLA